MEGAASGVARHLGQGAFMNAKVAPPNAVARHRFATWLAILAAVCAFGAVTASASSAGSNGGVYLVTPHSWGWCPTSSVKAVYFFNTTTGASGGDIGDDIAWVPVALNTSNELTITVGCTKPQENSGTYVFIRPTRSGQAWYVGPGAGTWHN
jgi:hypothetical protein